MSVVPDFPAFPAHVPLRMLAQVRESKRARLKIRIALPKIAVKLPRCRYFPFQSGNSPGVQGAPASCSASWSLRRSVSISVRRRPRAPWNSLLAMS
jgi:hypothetical protein